MRPCVSERGFATCAECPGYSCEKLATRLVTFQGIAASIGGPIPDEDRARFISPYENKERLDELRRKLG